MGRIYNKPWWGRRAVIAVSDRGLAALKNTVRNGAHSGRVYARERAGIRVVVHGLEERDGDGTVLRWWAG